MCISAYTVYKSKMLQGWCGAEILKEAAVRNTFLSAKTGVKLSRGSGGILRQKSLIWGPFLAISTLKSHQ